MRIATLLGAGAILLLSGNTAFSQQLKLGLNPYTVQKSALLELNSTNQGLLLARIADTTSINTMSPPDGMLIFFTPTRQLMIRANGGWQALTVAGGAITNLNGLTATTQTFATGTSGNDVGITSSGSVHTFNIPSASATARGVVTTGLQTFAGSKTITSASNPLNLFGVQAGTSTTADSLLTITSGLIRKIPMSTFSSASNFWALGGNSTGGVKNLGTLDNNTLPFITNGIERMRIGNTGDVGIGVTDPGNNLVVKDTMEIRRTGALSELLFSNTAGAGDFRIGSDGGDIFWQGGGGRSLQMGAYWTILLAGDRQSGTFPALVNGANNNTGVLVQAQRDASIPLAIAPNSSSQTGNLTEWRNSSGTAINAIDKNGNLGLGTSAPSTRLHVMGTNPLSLFGVQAGTSTTADSLLTITSGLVRKIPMSTFGAASSFWALGGNTVGAVKSFGTVDAFDLPFITANTERMRLSSTGNLGIGSSSFNSSNPEKLLVQAGTTGSFNLMQGHGRINNYLQINVQNDSAGTNASSDLVATADNGNESVNYVDLGINSSAFTGTGVIGGANNAYLYSTGNDFAIGNGTTGKSLLFFTGGVGSNEKMRITGTGTVGINTTSPAAQLDVAGTVKLGTTGTVEKNVISYTYTVPGGGLTVPAGTTGTVVIIGTVTYAAGTLDVNSAIPSSSQPSTTRATVSVSPDQDLPASVLIASSRLSTTGNVKIRFLNSSTNAATLPAGLNLFITITEF